MNPYTVQEGDKPRRAAVERWLYGLDQVSSVMRENIITAWVTTWSSSKYETLEEMPVAYGIDFPLMSHVNEVTKIGLGLAKNASSEWNITFDYTTLVPTLILHDVDKPLMYDRAGSEIMNSVLSREIAHGVLGAMLLKELGFEHKVVSTISLHASNSPYHGNSLDAWILHYADYFSADRMLMQMGRKPTYQK